MFNSSGKQKWWCGFCSQSWRPHPLWSSPSFNSFDAAYMSHQSRVCVCGGLCVCVLGAGAEQLRGEYVSVSTAVRYPVKGSVSTMETQAHTYCTYCSFLLWNKHSQVHHMPQCWQRFWYLDIKHIQYVHGKTVGFNMVTTLVDPFAVYFIHFNRI